MERRSAVITGAGGGIGNAVATSLLGRGVDVVGIGRTSPPLEAPSFRSGDSAGVWRAVAADVRNPSDLAAALDGLPSIHAVVANAGICKRGYLDDADGDDTWREVIETNLTGVWNTLRAVRGKLARGASVVVVSSGLGKLGRPGYNAYAASKHGVLGLVRCLAPELAKRNIRINAVCPGWVDTPMAEGDLGITAREFGIGVDAVRRSAEANIPLGRFVRPTEVSDLICWLLSDEASAITGQSYNIACGEFTV